MKKHHAFTLIEILIVLAIVSILAIVAISSFGLARQKARMDITADALVNLFKQQQSLARSGVGSVPMCYGIYFKIDDPAQVYAVAAPYIAVDASVDATKADFCDIRRDKLTISRFDQFEDNKLIGLSKFGVEVNELMVLFRPPRARVLVGDMVGLDNPSMTDNSSLLVTFESATGQDSRTVDFNVSSGVAQRALAPALMEPVKPLKPITPVKPLPQFSPSLQVTPLEKVQPSLNIAPMNTGMPQVSKRFPVTVINPITSSSP